MSTSKNTTNLGYIPTPINIVKYIINNLLNYLLKEVHNGINCDYVTILDHSVGDGRFLIEFSHKFEEENTKLNLSIHPQYFGIDINLWSIDKAKTNILNNCTKINHKYILKQGNTLLGYIYPPKGLLNTHSTDHINLHFINEYKIKNSDSFNKYSPFHWFKEYPDVIERGGFDIILGNPPYGISFDEYQKNIYKKVYATIDSEVESYILFLERSINLIRELGLIALLIPNNILSNLRYKKIRHFLLKKTKVLKIINLHYKIFPKIHVEACIIFLQKLSYNNKDTNHYIEFGTIEYINKKIVETLITSKANQNAIQKNQNLFLLPPLNQKVNLLLKRITDSSTSLKNLVYITRGIELGFNSNLTSSRKIDSKYVPLIACRSIRKYRIDQNTRFIQYDYTNKSIFKNYEDFTQPKLLLRRIGKELIASYDNNNNFCVCDVYILKLINNTEINDLFYIEGILNSSLMSFYIRNQFKNVKKIFPKIPIAFIKDLPIKITSNTLPIVRLVKKLHKIPWDRTDFTEKQKNFFVRLDNEVLNLYNINDAEKGLISKY